MNRFQAYLKVFDVSLQNTFVYRWNFLFRSLFGLLPLLGTIFIWGAIFEAKGEAIGSFDFGAMVYYFLLVMFLNGLITTTDDEWQVATDIREGQLNAYLIKPIDYMIYRFSLFAGNRLLYTVVTLPVVVLLFFTFRNFLIFPTNLQHWILSLVSIVLAGLLQFFISFSIALLAFWVLEISTFVFIIYSFEYFLSGQMFPLTMMPSRLQEALLWTPFPYEMYFPVTLFMGRIPADQIARGLTIQAIWVLIAFAGARVFWHKGLRRYGAYGG
ncbi:MAG: ABC-2 family transporter protein [Verrucomicrobia bacterium]|nr:ABC-2 family transporter protein [Verrucomicrobiota bacterium]